MSRDRRFIGKLTLLVWFAAGSMVVASGRPVDIPERARGADSVVVARASTVTPQWRTNAHGDQIIVSQIALQVEETLKGAPETAVVLELEGGTLDGLTLHVSDLPKLESGQRAVFFLKRSSGAAHVPYLRGLGILTLDGNVVRGSSLRLEDIRRMAAENRK
jgi:hypothetical protein